MAIIGALARVDENVREAAWNGLANLHGVTPFALARTNEVGLVVETESVEEGYRLIRDEISQVSGIVNVCVVYAHLENNRGDYEC